MNQALLQIAEGTARDLIQQYDVKKRLYFGNTSMDAEMSLLMANQALVIVDHFYLLISNNTHVTRRGVQRKINI